MKKFSLVCLLISISTLAACGPARLSDAEIAGTSAVIAAEWVAETAAAQPTATFTGVPPSETPAPSDTAVPSDTFTPIPTDTPSPTATFDYRSPNQLFNYYIVPEDDGTVGCSTNVAKVGIGQLPTGDPETDILAVVGALFAPKNRFVFGLYNPMYGSNVQVTGIEIVDGEYRVYTEGTLVRGEQGCTWDQLRTVINATIKNIPGGWQVEVRYKNHAINDYLTSDR
jgi:hypothetical protein